MFYISNLQGLQSPFKSKKIKDEIVTEANAISSVKSDKVADDLHREKNFENPYEKQIEKQKKQKQKLKRKLPKFAVDIMSSPIFTINQSEETKEARKIFRDKRFRHIPVVDDSALLVGILSDRDLFNIDDELQIKEVMSKDIITARPDASLRSISQVLIEEQIGCIPVVTEENKLQGIITRTDILRSLVRDAPLDLVF